MRVAFDGRSFFTGGTGDRTYFRNLLSTMARLACGDDYTLYYREFDADREAFARANDRIHTTPVKFPIGWLWAQCAVAPHLWRDRMHLYHAQYLLPVVAPRPMVVTIHDINFHLFPEWTPPRMRRIMNVLIPQAAHSARRVITGSEYTKRDIVRHFKVRPSKIIVTPYGVAPQMKPVPVEVARTQVASRYGLETPYLLGVGLRGDRKNPGIVLRAMRRLRAQGRWPTDMRLALTGVPHHFPDPEVQKASEEIAFLNYVADDDLPALYSAATACVYPSKYEGFGFPPLEAMACGCPVLCSNTSSLPEVVGDAGWLLPPTDEDAWADALFEILNNVNLRDELQQKGLLRAATFSWDRTARQTLEVYRTVVGPKN